MEPPPRSCMEGSTAWVTARTPRRLTPSTTSHMSSSVAVNQPKRSVPALLTTISSGPTASAAAATPARAEPASATSISTAAPSSSPATSRAPARSRSAIATRAPSAARRRAVAAPMPDAPPVTGAGLPSSRMRRAPYSLPRREPGGARDDHRRDGRARVRAGFAAGTGRGAGGDRVARGRARGGGGRAGARARPRRQLRGAGQPRGGRALAGRRPLGAVPQPVREPGHAAARSLARPAADRRDGPAGGGSGRPGHADAGSAPGLGRPAGGGDGARRRAGRLRTAHGERPIAERARSRAGRGRADLRRLARRQARSGRPAGPRGGAPMRGRRTAGDVAHRGVADRPDDLDQRPLQDPRRRARHRAARPAVGGPVVVLAGGTGGARLARGMLDVVGEDLVVVANTADDVEIYGAHVSPDPDLVLYWLADRIDERGWGLRDDTFHVMDGLRELGVDVWFNLGDRDLAVGLRRRELLAAGTRLTERCAGA